MKKARIIYEKQSNHLVEEMNKLDQCYEQKIISYISKYIGEIPNGFYREIESRKFEYRATSQGNASYPDVKYALLEIKKRYPYIRMFVASNAHSSHILGVLVGAQLISFFNEILGYEKIGYMKSNPQYWRKLMILSNSKPKESIFIGDTKDEALGCLKIGMPCIILNRSNDREFSHSNDNVVVVGNLKQVIEVLDNCYILT